jgi:hypothetical protein
MYLSLQKFIGNRSNIDGGGGDDDDDDDDSSNRNP